MSREHDLVIIGTGSGNSIPEEFDDVDIAIVEDGAFGGTCLNVGCIPTKMYVHPADLATGAQDAAALNVSAHVDSVDWVGMRDRIFGRIDSIEAGGREYRSGRKTPNITVYAGRGRFTGSKELTVALHDGTTQTIVGKRFLLAAGSRAFVPPIDGLDQVTYHTSDTVMRIDALPRTIAVLGCGYIAAEFAHIFSGLGSTVVQIVRADRLLRQHDADISESFTTAAAERYDLRTSTTVSRVEPQPHGVRLFLDGPDGSSEVDADVLLIATGRTPNGDELGVEATGVELDDEGRVVVDEYQRTGVDGIWALGDISTHFPLKHVANHEARVAFHNIAHPDDLIASDHRYVPAAVFTHPQIASVGLTEAEARDRGIDVAVARQDYGGIAAGWAREDTTNFAKLLLDRKTGLLVGAHIIGPEAATVIQPLIQGMSFDVPPHRLARGQYWIHPALPELVENALLQFPAP
ncbi:MAG: mycothione reductase [Williamsia herbipolensis]|nr:mycothione reductase [Williamsia herbipolensis]